MASEPASLRRIRKPANILEFPSWVQPEMDFLDGRVMWVTPYGETCTVEPRLNRDRWPENEPLRAWSVSINWTGPVEPAPVAVSVTAASEVLK